MRRRSMLLSVVLTVLPVGAIVEGAAADSSKPQEELMQIERDWAHAWSAKDAKAVDFEATEYTYTDFDGTVTNRASDVDLLKSPTMSLSYEVDDMKAKAFGDTGVVIGRQIQKGNVNNRDVGGVFRFTDTWVKRDGRWQCVASQITRIEKP